MNPDLLLGFWGVTFLLIVVPGPDWAFVLASGARDRRVIPAVAGLLLGYLGLTILVAAGVGAAVGRSAPLLTGLTLAGAGYLVWLGVSVLRKPGALQPVSGQPGTDASAPLRRVLAGVGVSGLNPKGLLVFLAMLPQFTDPHGRWPLPAQLAALGLVFVATCGIFYTVMGFGARTVLSAGPAAARTISRISGAAMILVGLLLLLERFH
ncbi:LysE family translocator [Nocardia mexicana]|uniref:Threonine/homoserine/homoserine lactone efflux protein n=1 Tax=Nocardia mexicana TaxID=279262 RepID=A0A370HBU0_9NOCA|nr:LysE family translocator [Nocardia mexicana]RDI54389.1 threonine/homoserine/homoserine lactone efflux protein [Nocardia mexicana]